MADRITDFVIAFVLSALPLVIVWNAPAEHQVAWAAGLLSFDIAYYHYRLLSRLSK